MKTVPVYFVQADNKAAMSLAYKLCDGAITPGGIIPLESDEWKALKESLVCLKVEMPE